MEKYVTNIKDLVIHMLLNGSKEIYKANNGDRESCFLVGMMHLLGINTPIDFNKASHYLSNQSLVGNQDATLLLAFIAECDGDYSKAFCYYAKTICSETDTFIDKIIKGRNNLQDLIKKLDLPISFNKEISSILKDYDKGKSSRIEVCIKIAAISNDEQICLEIAKCLFDAKDYISAIDWLKRGNVRLDDSMYITINEELRKATLDLLNSKDLQVINVENNSLLSKEDLTPFFDKVKKTCNEASMKCSVEWKERAKAYVNTIIKNQKDKEQEEYLAVLAEEEARTKKRNTYIICGIVAAFVLFFVIKGVLGSSSEDQGKVNEPTPAEATVVEKSNVAPKENREPSVQEEKEHEEKYSLSQQEKDNSGYDNVLSERRLSDEDLADKSKKELEIMRNSIYARYGYKFKREDLLNYFSQYSWYNPTTRDMGAIYNMMNDNEKYNVDFIKKHE